MHKIQPGKYRHYKGTIYEVTGIARHSETLEELVIYKHDSEYWVRPIEMFFENIEYKGRNVPRFQKL